MTTTNEYGYDDLDAGDTIEVMRVSPHGGTVDKIVGTVSARHIFGQQPKIETAFGTFDACRETDTFKLLERPRPALPDTPGTVGLATINGRRVRVMLVQNGSGTTIWVVASPTVPNPISGVYLAADEAITDFKRLDVIDPDTRRLA